MRAGVGTRKRENQIMNRLFNYPYLIACGLMSLPFVSLALDCNGPYPPSGPCIECTVKFSHPAQLLEAPPLYWDVCKGENHAETKIVYFLPTSISPLIKRGKLATRLRTLKNGDLKLIATLNYHPWGKDSLIWALRIRYPNLKIRPIIPWHYESKFFGNMNGWIKKLKIWTTPSGVGIFNKLTLTIVFHQQFAKQVKAALSRELGLLGKVTFVYKGYNQAGDEYDQIKHPQAIHLGGLH
ncbi:MAG: hypothetical protein DRR19_10295 [Candidatus Parabeggiatoa sp. nov. 1]|nr:MAG: hypothetical protein DRR19_10295 [Gammaproteobacteria bacterium]